MEHLQRGFQFYCDILTKIVKVKFNPTRAVNLLPTTTYVVFDCVPFLINPLMQPLRKSKNFDPLWSKSLKKNFLALYISLQLIWGWL
jgi:hypothetical protein